MKRLLIAVAVVMMVVAGWGVSQAAEVEKLYVQGISPTFNLSGALDGTDKLTNANSWDVVGRAKVKVVDTSLGHIGVDLAALYNVGGAFDKTVVSTGVYWEVLNLEGVELSYAQAASIDNFVGNFGDHSRIVLSVGKGF